MNAGLIPRIFLSNMMLLQLLQAIAIGCLAFIPIRKENAPKSCHNKCMPCCNYCFTILLFLALPIVIILAFFGLQVAAIDTGPLTSYLTFYVILALLLSLQFFVGLIDVFEKTKLEHAIAKNNGFENPAPEKLQESGKFLAWQSSARIGEPMRLREDMYSLMYVSLVKP